MAWQEQLKGNTLSWLLEEDNPGVRYLALRDLLDKHPADKGFSSLEPGAIARSVNLQRLGSIRRGIRRVILYMLAYHFWCLEKQAAAF